MSNAMLADILNNVRCELCIYRGGACRGKSCFDGTEAWLNAPVEKPEKQPTDNKAKKLSVELDKIL